LVGHDELVVIDKLGIDILVPARNIHLAGFVLCGRTSYTDKELGDTNRKHEATIGWSLEKFAPPS
jgi:hypothetical protein